ncbi:hypothetical protein P775_23555 [Puniceibacterium antarcticum]|uniref:Uncharacterized protein n=1 Tax=Puniceibacterium antarcticum TaxID=1206336 RepID=A0A2G8R824_9RHOB|nr:hypothetical protein P775_23555 [Puniceibacterium antarcticum]
MAIAQRSNMRKARIALARRLAVIMNAMLKPSARRPVTTSIVGIGANL